jgi:hypothetical protein
VLKLFPAILYVHIDVSSIFYEKGAVY